MAASTFAQNAARVACVGDSITYGDKLADRATQSYPAILERLSQGRYTVGNFGVNATTALQTVRRAWINTPAYREALAFAPDIVVIMLGINDLAFPHLHARYAADLRNLVGRFQSLPSAPRVFLCTLTPIAPAEQQMDANQTIRDAMNPAIRSVAVETEAAVIDLSAAFPNQLDFLPDGLHPSPAGAELIARTVLAALDAPASVLPQIQPAPAAGPVDISIRNEARAAKVRAELWLKNQPAPIDLQDPRADKTSADLLPLLSGHPAQTNESLFYSYAALAFALDRKGEKTVFPAPDRPVAWREALLHQLVQRQRIDPQGGGFWGGNPEENDPPVDAIRSTAYALKTIDLILGP